MPSVSSPTNPHPIRRAYQTFHDRLFSQTPIPVPLLQPTISHVTHLLQSTFSAKTPPISILLIGPTSSGKSLILSRALSALPASAAPTILGLHGLLHTTPLAAWRALAAQFPHHHPTTPQADYLSIVNYHLQTLATDEKPLLFVLDAFDLFSNDFASQTILYSIFNYMQDRTLRAVCVAMTTKIDATDRLEKRVKSRFAPREVVIPLPKDADQILQFMHSALANDTSHSDDTIDGDKASDVAKRTLSQDKVSYWMQNDVQTFQQSSRALIDSTSSHRSDENQEFYQVAESLLHSTKCQELVRRYIKLNRVIEPALRAMDVALSTAFAPEILGTPCGIGATTNAQRMQIALKTLEENLLAEDTLAKMVESVSGVELALLAALRRIKGKATFADVLRVYETLGREEGLVRGEDGEAVAGRVVVEKCWERLIEGGLIVRSGTGPKVSRTVVLAVSGDIVDQVIVRHAGASTRMARWAREEVRR